MLMAKKFFMILFLMMTFGSMVTLYIIRANRYDSVVTKELQKANNALHYPETLEHLNQAIKNLHKLDLTRGSTDLFGNSSNDISEFYDRLVAIRSNLIERGDNLNSLIAVRYELERTKPPEGISKYPFNSLYFIMNIVVVISFISVIVYLGVTE